MPEPSLTSDLPQPQPQPSEAESGQRPPPAPRESWRSEELLGDRSEVLIVHGSEVYRLRRTRQDKLILYK